LLADLWNPDAINRFPRIFEARLIPLNKVWPDIPKEDQFRPIVVLSPIFKWLERRFLPKLQNYLTTRLDRNQTGFVAGMGTSVNILLLAQKLRSTFKRQGECCIFIDYKSAYNTVNRLRLYRILKEKNILSPPEVDFLQGMHDALYFSGAGGQRFYLRNGVH
jgi:hypothetical protein